MNNKSPCAEIANKIGDLMHEGTLTAIKKIKKIIAAEKDPIQRAYAQSALEECQYFYYSPDSPKEEKEFNLLKLIQKKEEELIDLEVELNGFIYKSGRLNLEADITKKLMRKVKDKYKKLQWENELKGIAGVQSWYQCKQMDLREQIGFLEAWIVEARKNITVEKYKNIPLDVLHSIHHDYEDWEENEKLDHASSDDNPKPES
ncbi:MAG: hypothetical protein K9L85_01905 [Candidatus Peribacteraceae bacterium]|nr:hypothetical protein [Candidatus Peribacteraceae bacterium]